MKNPRPLIITAVVVVVIAAVFGLRFRQLGQGEAVASIRAVQQAEGVPVQTVPVVAEDLETWITLAGTVEGTTQYSIVSNNSLQVIGIPVREGDRVSKGDVIIRLATGAPSPMYHSLDRARAGYEKALVDVRRLRNLYAEGAVAKAELDAAETSLQMLAADLQDAEGSSALVASAPGVVTSLLVNVGETVDTGEPLAWIADASSVKLVFAAGSAQALALAEGQTARWLLPDGSIGGQGTVSQLDLMADRKTHLLSGEAAFTNPDGRLVPGLLITFEVRVGHQPGVLTLPRECVVDHEGQPAVWVVSEGGQGAIAELRAVTTGLQDSDRIEITGGLAPGDEAVRHGQTLLSYHALVRRVDLDGSQEG